MTPNKTCPICGAALLNKRSDAVWCSRPCKARATWEKRAALLAFARETLSHS
jgi:hypothetical protein